MDHSRKLMPPLSGHVRRSKFKSMGYWAFWLERDALALFFKGMKWTTIHPVIWNLQILSSDEIPKTLCSLQGTPKVPLVTGSRLVILCFQHTLICSASYLFNIILLFRLWHYQQLHSTIQTRKIYLYVADGWGCWTRSRLSSRLFLNPPSGRWSVVQLSQGCRIASVRVYISLRLCQENSL